MPLTLQAVQTFTGFDTHALTLVKTLSRQKHAKPYMWAIIALGSVCFLFSGLKLHISELDIRCLFLALITIGIGSRISIKIPRVKGHISVSDTFIFLSILLFGGEVAVLLAATEAL